MVFALVVFALVVFALMVLALVVFALVVLALVVFALVVFAPSGVLDLFVGLGELPQGVMENFIVATFHGLVELADQQLEAVAGMHLTLAIPFCLTAPVAVSLAISLRFAPAISFPLALAFLGPFAVLFVIGQS